MGYVAVGEITDAHASKKTRLKLACLAHVMSYNSTSWQKIQEFKQLQSLANKHIKELESSEFSQAASIAIKESSIDAMRNSIKVADQSIEEINNNVTLNNKRQDYLFKSLIQDGYVDFKDRAFTVAFTGRHVDFLIKNEEKEGSWVVDNKKIAELFVLDFKESLPEGIPDKAFSFSLLKNRECRFGEKSDALIVTFNHVLEDSAKEAMVKVTKKNLARMTQEQYPENLKPETDLSETHTLKYDDVKHIARCMPYLVETTGSRSSAGELTIEILRSSDPVARMKEIELQEQFPLINIERYATFDNKLKGFIEDAFGGSIGRSEEGYRKAMKICMGHYAEEQSKEFNIEKELAKVDEKIIGKVEHGVSDYSM